MEDVAHLADRVDGCMNFACFLPFDTLEVVNGQRHVPAPIDSNLDEKMLSPRDAAAQIGVYADSADENGKPIPGAATGHWIDGNYLACYSVLGTSQDINGKVWYRIQYEAMTATDSGIRWVPQRGDVNEESDIIWVHIQEGPTPAAVTPPITPLIISLASSVPVRVTPDATASQRGSLVVNTRYSVTGTFWDTTNVNLSVLQRRWWRFSFNGNASWVRGDAVLACGNLTGIPSYSGTPTNLILNEDPVTPPVTTTANDLWLEVNADTTLNVREDAGLIYSTVGSVSSGQKYAIRERAETEVTGPGKIDDVWWQIRLATTSVHTRGILSGARSTQ